MPAMGLTAQQHTALSFISERVRETGIGPSYEELMDAMAIKSKSGVHRVVSALEDRGFVRRFGKRARAIQVLKLPENLAAGQRPPMSRDQVRHGEVPGERSRISVDGAVRVPVVGRLGAATPIEALQNKMAEAVVSSALMGRGNHYALEVVGDVMVGAGILDGDTIVVQETDRAQSGELVVALVDKSTVVLRRLRQRREFVVLQPANPAYENRTYSADRVAIQGRVTAVVRRY